jgi:hypothetical protein
MLREFFSKYQSFYNNLFGGRFSDNMKIETAFNVNFLRSSILTKPNKKSYFVITVFQHDITISAYLDSTGTQQLLDAIVRYRELVEDSDDDSLHAG